ncbi:MAG: lytic transglycosylase domain-containing protein [Deltaproteobacteria bacterium]
MVHFTNTPCDVQCDLYIREAPRPAESKPTGDLTREWMDDYVERFSRANDLSPALVKAIIRAESNGKRFAVSPKGAQGMMQLMPFTSKRMQVSDPFDPVENIEGGVRYIKELFGVFRGNLEQTVAAYNAGPEAVRKYGGVPPYKETRQYVKRVLDYYRQYSSGE